MALSNPFGAGSSTSVAGHTSSSDTAPLAGSERILLGAVVVSVVLDVLTNVFNPSPVVAPLKGLILFVVIFSFRTLYSYYFTLFFFGIFAVRELNVALTQKDLFLMGDATFFLRILFFVTWLLLFYERRRSTTFLRRVMHVAVATIILSVLGQLIGMFFHLSFFAAYAHQGRGGYKGLFLSENDTGVFYLTTLIYSLFLMRTGKWLLSAIIFAGLILLGLGSKTALLGALAVPLVYFCCVHKFRSPFVFRRLAIRPRITAWWATGFLAVGAIVYFAYLYFSDLISIINYDQLLRVYQESGLMSSLLSFRDQKVLAYFHSIRSVFDVLFGLQLRVKPEGFANDEPGSFMYEIDLFDYLARVGLIGSVLTVALIWRSALLRNWSSRPPELRALIITIVLLGCTVGHTLISSMNGLWIGFWLIALGNLALEDPSRVHAPKKSTAKPLRSLSGSELPATN